MSLTQTIIQFINVVVFVGGMYLIFDRKRAQKRPDNPMERLEMASRIAVQAAKKRYPNNPGQRDLAIGHVADLYKEWELPVPSKLAIELAIDAEALE